MKNTKHLIITALCMTLGVVLPMAFHMIPNAGSVMLPMHIPVLLCGLVCGPILGLICGIFTPVLSSLITGMFKEWRTRGNICMYGWCVQ